MVAGHYRANVGNGPPASAIARQADRETAAGLANPEHLAKAKTETIGLGLFVRSLVGLDRDISKQAFGGLMTGKMLTANQLEFVNLISCMSLFFGAPNPNACAQAAPLDERKNGSWITPENTKIAKQGTLG